MKRIIHFLIFLFLIVNLISCKEEVIPYNGNILSNFHLEKKNYDSAIYFSKESLRQNLGNESDFLSYFLLAYSYEGKLEYKKSSEYYLLALKYIPEDKEYDENRFRILNNIGKLCKIHKKYDLALEYYNKSLSYVGEKEKATVLFNLGNVHRSKKDYNQASQLYLKALELAIDRNDLHRQVKINNRLGLLYSDLKEFEKARSYYQTVVNYQGDTSKFYKKYIGKSLHNVGSSYMYQEKYETAIPYFLKALRYKKQEEDRFITYMDLGTSYTKLANYELAHSYYLKAEEIFDRVKLNEKNIELFNLMKLSYRASGNINSSIIYADYYIKKVKEYLQTRDQLIDDFTAFDFSNNLEEFKKDQTFSDAFRSMVLKNRVLISGILLILIFAGFVHYRKNRAFARIKKVTKDLDSFMNNIR